jgi:Leucine-rich repeat (LRR) protein
MKKLLYIILVSLLLKTTFSSVSIFAQRTCGTYNYTLLQINNNPRYKERNLQIEEFTSSMLRNQEKMVSGIITIPVHIILVYSNTLQNISDAQILSQLSVLNQDFRKLNYDWLQTPSEFIDLAGDLQIQFTLEGIERHSNSKPTWGTADLVKTTYPPYSPNTHLNIWICNIGSNYLGYATPPGGNIALDGLVISPQYFGSSDYNDGSFYLSFPFDKGRTATHELGHWLNLHHIWGDGDCSATDNVNDTPSAAKPNYHCPVHPHVSCDHDNMFMNYMDYTDDACMFMFTKGQKERARSVFSPGGPRENFVTGMNFICDAEACDDTINLSLTLDNNPDETSWSLTDTAGNVINEGFGYHTAGQVISKKWILSPGKYIFSIYDSHGDGICCSGGGGEYELKDGCNNIIKYGGSFWHFESITFCVPEKDEITIKSPNGGESLQRGSIHTIKWTSTGRIDSVGIKYSADNGLNWMTIAANTPNNGTYTWIIPDVFSSECFLSMGPANGSALDSSDASFSIGDFSGLITDSLSLASIYNLTNGSDWFDNSNWLSGPLNSWKGIITTDERVTSISLANNNLNGYLPAEIGNLTELKQLELSENKLKDKIPEEINKLINLSIINIKHNKLDDLPLLSGISSLQELRVDSNLFTFEDIEPNMHVAENLFTYSHQDSVGIKLSTRLGEGKSATYSVLVKGEHNLYQWYKNDSILYEAQNDTLMVVNATLEDSGLYICKITNSIANALTLTSRPIHLIIDSAFVKVIAPNGNESWPTGSYQDIKWTSGGMNGVVAIDYSEDNGINWSVLAEHTTNDGKFTWYIPALDASNCLIRVRDVNGIPYDISDNVFSIYTAVGLTNYRNESILVYPNPCSDFVYIQFIDEEGQYVEIQLLNILGQTSLLLTKEINNNRFEIPVSRLERGFYFIRIISASGTYTVPLNVE